MAVVELRYDPKDSAWFSANPTMVLKAGEPAYLSTTGQFKLGDGTTQLSALPFLPAGSGITLTTTGTSGASTLVSNVLNIPIYSGGSTPTNLSTSQTAINFTINSDTGTDAIVPLGNGTLAGATLNDYTTAEKTKLSGIATGAEVNVNADWNATSGDAQILNKPTIPSISGLATVTYVDTQDALKVDKIVGKGLSTEDYTTTEKNKLAGIASGAEVNVNADWNAVSGDAEILNKPTIPSIAGLELQANKQNSLTIDGTGVKYPTVDAINSAITNINTNAVDTITVKLALPINKGQAVYISSANGTNIIVSKASNTSEATSSKTLGLLETTGTTNDIVNVVTDGLLGGLNTSTATIGDPVWLGVTGALIFGLASKPYAPAHLVYIGVVSRVSATVGEIIVKVQNGFELKEIHDVDLITTSPNNNEILTYESSTSLWKNKTVTTDLGYTPENTTNKSDSYTASSSTTYSSTKALVDGLALKQSFQLLSITSSATPAINTGVFNLTNVTITALATAITSMTSSLTGTPSNFDKLLIRIKDNGTARAITWGTSFSGSLLPTTTVISTPILIGFIYDSVLTKWVCVAVN